MDTPRAGTEGSAQFAARSPGAPAVRWHPTWALARSGLVGVTGPLTAVVIHQPSMLVATAPMAVIAVWSVLTRPSGEVAVSSRIGRHRLREGRATTVRYTAEPPPGSQELCVSAAETPWVETRPTYGVLATLVEGPEPLTVEVVTRMTRWGRHAVGQARIGALSSWAAYRWGPVMVDDHQVEVIPAAPVFDTVAPMPHPQGLVGIDRSVRPGEGSEFASIRQFQHGDRLRRIHWPSSLRSRSLNVTATYADHDSQVLVLVDASNDVGRSGGLDGSPSTLDATVRSAAALCEHYVRRGDRVGLHVTGATRAVHLRSSTGRQHLRRVLSALAAIRPGGQAADASETRLQVDPGALVLLCSPLISPATMERAVGLVRRGLTVVVIDTLPDQLEHQPGLALWGSEADELAALAWRIRLLERDADVTRVVEAGVPVVPWRGPGSLDQVLRDASRRARMPRLALR